LKVYMVWQSSRNVFMDVMQYLFVTLKGHDVFHELLDFLF
jgi:hypothetical protein